MVENADWVWIVYVAVVNQRSDAKGPASNTAKDNSNDAAAIVCDEADRTLLSVIVRLIVQHSITR